MSELEQKLKDRINSILNPDLDHMSFDQEDMHMLHACVLTIASSLEDEINNEKDPNMKAKMIRDMDHLNLLSEKIGSLRSHFKNKIDQSSVDSIKGVIK